MNDRLRPLRPDNNLAYGSRGTIAALTPQANTVVEPELWALLPSGVSLLNARMVSSLPSMNARLRDYSQGLEGTLSQFANAPVDTFAFACTGASYLSGHKREQQRISELVDKFERPIITSANATATALQLIGASNIALLSPYPQELHHLSMKYWRSRGFHVVAVASPTVTAESFHPIYGLSTQDVTQAYERLSDTAADIVLMLGTGMPTLGAHLFGIRRSLMPAVSCNLALAWLSVCATSGEKADLDSLTFWLSATEWESRFGMLHSSPPGRHASGAVQQ